MRIIRPAVALLVALSLAAAALTYLHSQTSEGRIYVQAHRASTPSHVFYGSRFSRKATRIAHRAARSADPYHQRYYSESEGWTYYTLPSYSSETRIADR